MKIKLLLSFSLLFSTFFFAQQSLLSQNAEISVLTIGPGDNLNDAFGHNAFRIKDGSLGLDIVYGYGEYDFNTPNFYLKFAQGKLNYQMSKTDFSDFYGFYKYYNRTIKEQTLNLSISEKQRLYDYLLNNYKPENRKYLYDFFYDNCATRIRDVAKNAIEGNIKFNTPENFEPKTFRKLIHNHVGLNTWGSFGIDIALGSVIDREASPYEQMFLPKYIHENFEKATLNSSKKLVKKSTIIYKRSDQRTSINFLFSPLMVLGILSMIILYITYTDHKDKRRSKWLDIILFGITGIIGVAILFLWFATDHTATAHNYNLLWAFPINIFIIGQLFNSQVKNWFRKYLKFLIIMFVLMTFHWIIGIQVFTIGLIPLLIALIVRYIYLVKYFK
jgi:hypothetical protein